MALGKDIISYNSEVWRKVPAAHVFLVFVRQRKALYDIKMCEIGNYGSFACKLLWTGKGGDSWLDEPQAKRMGAGTPQGPIVSTYEAAVWLGVRQTPAVAGAARGRRGRQIDHLSS